MKVSSIFTNNHSGLRLKNKAYTDDDAINSVIKGNTGVYEILIRRYNPVLYKIGRGYGFNHQDVEDLMQDTFISAYQALNTFKRKSSFKTWLIRIFLNKCYHKTHKRHSFKEEMLSNEVNKLDLLLHNNESGEKMRNSSPVNEVINKELGHIIECAVEGLPYDYKLTFVLREISGMSVKETAELMQTTTNNVKVRLNRAKNLLKKEIEKYYSSTEIFEFNLVYCDRIVFSVMNKIDEV